eukprot:PhF_6_TR6189/c0_g1_i1/m.9286
MAQQLDKTTVKVGMRIQNALGETGTIRWIGEFKGSGSLSGNYCGIEFDTPRQSTSKVRHDGKYAGKQVFTCAPKTGEFIKAKYLEKEILSTQITIMQKQFPDVPPLVLRKFLIARKCNVAAATEMLSKNLKWRQSAKPNHIEVLPKCFGDDYPIGWQGLDREGNLIHIERPGNGGKCPIKVFMKKYGLPQIIRWHLTVMESVQHKMAAVGATRCTILLDLSNLGSLGSKAIDWGKQISAIDQDNYPENIYRLFIINAPGFFSAVWSIVKTFLDVKTRERIQIFGTSGYKDALLDVIPEEMLPTFAGGKNDSWLLAQNGCVGDAADVVLEGGGDDGADDDDTLPPVPPGGECISPPMSPVSPSN